MISLLQEGALRMSSIPLFLCYVVQSASTLLTVLGDAARFLRLSLRSPATLAAENLFLRKQLALNQERHVKPRRTTAQRWALSQILLRGP